ncbi:uncharacterized protein LOC104584270 [Brachypodium distachyon]|uniref:uncharacterized protein LOC104584270 n=1 Tax=Brachypodium distachyon TaxID=15368 RepID=UPI000D0D6DD9|nr:uncharacterized protein LOC104584270 [Brachypodium distachyon]|eukprot:XP_024317227.1 uncharacterized protein LOC104584270 [Brachypodium distachyon]
MATDTSRLATFTLTHVGTAHRHRLALDASGVLSLTVRSICCCSPASDPQHRHAPLGVARLDIPLEGLYTKTANGGYGGGGERVLCMVGKAFPMRGGNITCPCDDAEKNVVSDSFQPPPVIDDCNNMLLVLRYPKEQTLTSRAVRGKMMSTRADKSDNVYFDTVWLASQLDHFSGSYQFRPEEEEEELAATVGCGTRSSLDDVSEDVPICDILRDNENTALSVVPNWECDSTDEFFCGQLGPFTAGDNVMSSLDRAFLKDFVLMMQGLRCEQTTGLDGKGAALVSAVFRAVPPWEGLETAVRRTGLSGMTLSAEGVWRASTGQLCMTGCLGTGTCKACCQHRVSLHVPTMFSLTRRSIIVGQITSLDGGNFPLSFQRALHPRQSWNKVGRCHSEEWLRMVYSYTKVEQAMELLRRSKTSSNLVAKAKSLLLSYPNKEHVSGTGDDEMMSLSDLSEDLGLNSSSCPNCSSCLNGSWGNHFSSR